MTHVEGDFDTSEIKNAVHVEHDSLEDAVFISRTLAIICENLEIPIGHLDKPGYRGSGKGASESENSRGEYAPCYLHPQFLNGEKAKAFVNLLKELTETDCWTRIAGYLLMNCPVRMENLIAARKQFAPELLLPVELRSLAKHIPADADKSELAHLAAKIGGLDDRQREVFDAVVEAGWHCGSVAEIINLTGNLDCFDLRRAVNESQYGDYRISRDRAECETAIHRLDKSDDPADRALVKHIMRLTRIADSEAYGYHVAKEEGSVFTAQGLISMGRGLEQLYHGVHDIPAEYRTPEAQAASGREKPSVMKKIAEARTKSVTTEKLKCGKPSKSRGEEL
jgi:hypothetical protein